MLLHAVHSMSWCLSVQIKLDNFINKGNLENAGVLCRMLLSWVLRCMLAAMNWALSMLQIKTSSENQYILASTEKLNTTSKKLSRGLWRLHYTSQKPTKQNHEFSDVFNIQVVVLVSYEEKEEQFRRGMIAISYKLTVDSLREKFFQSIAPGGLAGDRQVDVLASDFSFNAQRIWEVIKANKDLDLPAHKVMVATIRCQEIAKETYSLFVANEDWLELEDAIQSHPVQGFANEDSEAVQSHLVPGYGDTLISLLYKCLSWLYKCLSSYDDATFHYETSVRLEERNQLEQKLVQLVQPAYRLLLDHLRSVTLKNFKTALDHDLNTGQGFAMAARDCTNKFTRLFDEQYASIKIANWESANIGVRFSRDISSHVTDARTAKLSELTNRYELKLKEALSYVGELLREGHGDVWPAIREYYNRETQKVASEFSFALASFEMDEHDKADMISELMNYASRQVEPKTKEVAREVLYIMKDRYTSIFYHDNDLRPRSWTAEDDIQAITRIAQTSSLKVLSVLAAIRLDDKDTDTIYDTLVHTLLDEPRKKTTISLDPLGSRSWEKEAKNCRSKSWNTYTKKAIFVAGIVSIAASMASMATLASVASVASGGPMPSAASVAAVSEETLRLAARFTVALLKHYFLAGCTFSFSVEAEYRDVVNDFAETCWLCNLLRELHTPVSFAALVYCDNVSAVYLSYNHVRHQCTKHVEIDIHFVRDLIVAGHVRVLHVPSRSSSPRVFPSALFSTFRDNLSVCSIFASTVTCGYFTSPVRAFAISRSNCGGVLDGLGSSPTWLKKRILGWKECSTSGISEDEEYRLIYGSFKRDFKGSSSEEEGSFIQIHLIGECPMPYGDKEPKEHSLEVLER
ncbi:protein root hair defective 3 [Tanacetum coccineum]